MLNSDNISLVNALDVSIKRIKRKFDENWIITGGNSVDTNLLCSEDQQIILKYEKISEPENHNFTEICICLDGICALQIDGYIHEIKEGDVCLISPGVLHNELPKRGFDYTAIWMAINLNRAEMHLSGKNTEKGSFYTFDGYTLKSEYDFNFTLNRIRIEVTNKSIYYMEVVKTCIMELLVTSLRKILDETENKLGNESWKESIVLQVENFIKVNYSRNIRLSDVSQEVCISANYLNTIFKSVVGKTIIQYAEDFKIDKAKDLLVNTNLSTASIAEQLSYYDQYHFSKIFKKESGYTPTQFRKLQLDFTLK